MDKTDWLLLSTIAKEKSMTKAAEKMYISQPAVSYRLNKMEQEFRRLLFVRNSKGIELTGHGEVLLSYAKDMLQRTNEISNVMDGEDFDGSGKILIGTTSNFLHLYLAKQVRQFSSLYPNIAIHLSVETSVALRTSFNDGKVNVAIIRGAPPKTQTENMVVVHTAPLVMVGTEPLTDEYITSHPYIVNNRNMLIDVIAREWLNEHAALHITEAPIVVNGDSNSVKDIIRAGFGWGILSQDRISDSDCFYTRPLYNKNNELFHFMTYMLYNNNCAGAHAYKTYLNHFRNYFNCQ